METTWLPYGVYRFAGTSNAAADGRGFDSINAESIKKSTVEDSCNRPEDSVAVEALGMQLGCPTRPQTPRNKAVLLSLDVYTAVYILRTQGLSSLQKIRHFSPPRAESGGFAHEERSAECLGSKGFLGVRTIEVESKKSVGGGNGCERGRACKKRKLRPGTAKYGVDIRDSQGKLPRSVPTFGSPEEAARCYDAVAIYHEGLNATTNFCYNLNKMKAVLDVAKDPKHPNANPALREHLQQAAIKVTGRAPAVTKSKKKPTTSSKPKLKSRKPSTAPSVAKDAKLTTPQSSKESGILTNLRTPGPPLGTPSAAPAVAPQLPEPSHRVWCNQNRRSPAVPLTTPQPREPSHVPWCGPNSSVPAATSATPQPPEPAHMPWCGPNSRSPAAPSLAPKPPEPSHKSWCGPNSRSPATGIVAPQHPEQSHKSWCAPNSRSPAAAVVAPQPPEPSHMLWRGPNRRSPAAPSVAPQPPERVHVPWCGPNSSVPAATSVAPQPPEPAHMPWCGPNSRSPAAPSLAPQPPEHCHIAWGGANSTSPAAPLVAPQPSCTLWCGTNSRSPAAPEVAPQPPEHCHMPWVGPNSSSPAAPEVAPQPSRKPWCGTNSRSPAALEVAPQLPEHCHIPWGGPNSSSPAAPEVAPQPSCMPWCATNSRSPAAPEVAPQPPEHCHIPWGGPNSSSPAAPDVAPQPSCMPWCGTNSRSPAAPEVAPQPSEHCHIPWGGPNSVSPAGVSAGPQSLNSCALSSPGAHSRSPPRLCDLQWPSSPAASFQLPLLDNLLQLGGLESPTFPGVNPLSLSDLFSNSPAADTWWGAEHLQQIEDWGQQPIAPAAISGTESLKKPPPVSFGEMNNLAGVEAWTPDVPSLDVESLGPVHDELQCPDMLDELAELPSKEWFTELLGPNVDESVEPVTQTHPQDPLATSTSPPSCSTETCLDFTPSPWEIHVEQNVEEISDQLGDMPTDFTPELAAFLGNLEESPSLLDAIPSSEPPAVCSLAVALPEVSLSEETFLTLELDQGFAESALLGSQGLSAYGSDPTWGLSSSGLPHTQPSQAMSGTSWPWQAANSEEAPGGHKLVNSLSIMQQVNHMLTAMTPVVNPLPSSTTTTSPAAANPLASGTSGMPTSGAITSQSEQPEEKKAGKSAANSKRSSRCLPFHSDRRTCYQHSNSSSAVHHNYHVFPS